MFQVLLKEFDSNWSNLFLNEAKNIINILGDEIVSVFHIGSTSIENMEANEIIDIAICVDSLKEKEYYINILNKLNYKDTGYFKQENWFIFSRYDSKYNIHLGSYNSEEIINLMLFKLYISKHNDYKKSYIELKKTILEYGEETFYEINKQDFVFKVITLAKLELIKDGFSDLDFDIIFNNGIILNNKKIISNAIIEFLKRADENSPYKLKDLEELHNKVKKEVIEEVKKSPFLHKMKITDMNGNEISMDKETENHFKALMSNSFIRHRLRN